MSWKNPVPILDVVRVLHHPNFYWGALNGHTNCKYLNLLIDTRDNACVVKDRDGKIVDWDRLKAQLEIPAMAEMNSNPQIEIRETAPARE